MIEWYQNVSLIKIRAWKLITLLPNEGNCAYWQWFLEIYSMYIYAFHIPCYRRTMKNDFKRINHMHDDVIKWKHFPRNWPFVRGIHRSPHKGQWRGALMFSFIYAWINDWVYNREAGDLRRQCGHYDVIVMGILRGILYETTNRYVVFCVVVAMSSEQDPFTQIIPADFTGSGAFVWSRWAYSHLVFSKIFRVSRPPYNTVLSIYSQVILSSSVCVVSLISRWSDISNVSFAGSALKVLNVSCFHFICPWIRNKRIDIKDNITGQVVLRVCYLSRWKTDVFHWRTYTPLGLNELTFCINRGTSSCWPWFGLDINSTYMAGGLNRYLQ